MSSDENNQDTERNSVKVSLGSSQELAEQVRRQQEMIRQFSERMAEPMERFREQVESLWASQGFSSQMEEILERQRTVSDLIGETHFFQQAARNRQQISEAVAALTAETNFHEQIQQLLQTYKAEWASVRKLAEQLSRELPEDVDRFGALMLKLGWPPPHDLTIPEGQRLVDAYESGDATAEDIAAALVDFYGETQLERMEEDWRERDWLGRRMPILSAVVKAHINGDYQLTVPTLLPQIEGALAEAFGHQGRIGGREVKAYAEQLFQDDAPGHLWERTKDFYLQLVLDGFEWGGSIPELSRHAILHGADTDYDTPENSLRVILLFDHLQSAVRYVGSEGGHVFHRPACSVVRSAKTDRQVFRTRSEARSAKDRACKVCLPHIVE